MDSRGKTSQIVESLNGVFVKARMDAPYRLNAQILKWQGERLEERTENMKKWIQEKHPLTQYATHLFQVQVYTWATIHMGPNTHGPQHAWAQTRMHAQLIIRLPWLNVRAKRLRQVALESTT